MPHCARAKWGCKGFVDRGVEGKLSRPTVDTMRRSRRTILVSTPNTNTNTRIQSSSGSSSSSFWASAGSTGGNAMNDALLVRRHGLVGQTRLGGGGLCGGTRRRSGGGAPQRASFSSPMATDGLAETMYTFGADDVVDGNGGAAAEGQEEEGALACGCTEGGILTVFRWPRHISCKRVSLKGSFDGWRDEYSLNRTSSGDWTCTMPLPGGRVEFKFVVDGRYMTSPSEPVVGASSGTYNNIRLVHPSALFTWPTAILGGEDVSVIGEWDYWEGSLSLAKAAGKLGRAGGSSHRLECCLPPGKYAYYFMVDGEIKLRPDVQVSKEPYGREVNFVQVSQPPAVRLFYATGWAQPKLKARWIDEQGAPVEDWRIIEMHETSARPHMYNDRSCKSWKFAILDCCDIMQIGAKPKELEFVPFDPVTGKEDHPSKAEFYHCAFPGGYKLDSGVIKPFNQACDPPMMLVSDIDGTLVGTSPESYDVTARFAKYWEERASLTGSFLVYNTGRSLGQVTGLLESMEGILPIPDALITAVGTKIYLLDREDGHRGSASGLGWHEDMDWAQSLDEGWDLEQVRNVGADVIKELTEERAHWLDDGSEHPHRIALSVHVDSVESAKRMMQEKLNNMGILFKLISSGTLDWRYIDCVSGRAGKHAALEHIRSLYGIAIDRCVAAGDSGNDILMLEGPNPGIVVGNAQPTLVEWVVRQPQDGRIVVADAHLSDGVIEGLGRHQLY